jgi:hypothetical protein
MPQVHLSRSHGHVVMLPEGRRMRRPPVSRKGLLMRVLYFLAAMLAGVACGIYHLRSGHTAMTAVALAGAALVAAALWPAWGLSSGVAVALGVPVAYLGASFLGVPIPFPPTPHFAATLIAFLPAVSGALLGLLVRRLLAGSPERPMRVRL